MIIHDNAVCFVSGSDDHWVVALEEALSRVADAMLKLLNSALVSLYTLPLYSLTSQVRLGRLPHPITEFRSCGHTAFRSKRTTQSSKPAPTPPSLTLEGTVLGKSSTPWAPLHYRLQATGYRSHDHTTWALRLAPSYRLAAAY